MDSEIVAAIIMAIASVAPSSIAAIRGNGVVLRSQTRN